MAKQFTIQSTVIIFVIIVATFLSNYAIQSRAKGKDDGLKEQKITALEESDNIQNTKIEHIDDVIHTEIAEIKTSIQLLVLEQKHMNEGIKKLAGVN